MNKIYLLLISLAGFTSLANAQKGTVSGAINAQNKPVEAASVGLLLARDSSVVQKITSDKTGNFLFEKIKSGKYLVAIQSVGYQKYYSNQFELNDKQNSYKLPGISLEAAAQKLGDVVVTSKKAEIEQKLDKTVVNVDASPSNVGLNALEVLEKSPGITLDKDGNISLKGRGGVTVMIDGRPTYMSATDLVNFLKNLPSTSLDQIEIMSNPSSKYDAAGNSGIINIKTKKSKIRGLNASVTVGGGIGMGIAEAAPKTNNSLNLNYRTGKWNFFGNYSYAYNKNPRKLELTRKFRDLSTNAVTTIFQQETNMDSKYESHNYKAGADYFMNKKTTIGFVYSGYYNPGKTRTDGVTNIMDADAKLQNQTVVTNDETMLWKGNSFNFNLRQLFDTTGTELNVDVDVVGYNSTKTQDFRNIFYDNSHHVISPDELLKGDLPSDINIYSAKADFTHPFKKDWKLETGVKSSYVKTDNDAKYFDFQSGDWRLNTNRSNHFIYKENINAAYVNLAKEFSKKWNAQVGVRMENTNADGNQVTTGQTFKRNYTQLFPTAFIGYNINDKNQLGFNYGRRIQRPNYEDMNPFYYFLDKYTYQVGNPYLQPQFSQNVELNHIYRNMITTGVSYSKTTDIILDVLSQVDSTKTTFINKRNVAKSSSWTINTNINAPIKKWWRLNLYAQFNYSTFNGLVNGEDLNVSGSGFVVNASNQFQLPKGLGFEINGFFRSRTLQGTLVSQPMGAVNIGMSKQILKNKGTIRLNVRDVLGIQNFRGYSRYQNIDLNIKNQWNSRVITASFTYRFSKGQAGNQSQRRRGGAGDEQNRVGGGGGN